MDCGEEEERADAFVEIRLAAAVSVEFDTRGEQLGDGAPLAPLVDGLVASRGISGLDEIDDALAHGQSARTARSSMSCVSTRSRSRPESESASCASSRP